MQGLPCHTVWSNARLPWRLSQEEVHALGMADSSLNHRIGCAALSPPLPTSLPREFAVGAWVNTRTEQDVFEATTNSAPPVA